MKISFFLSFTPNPRMRKRMKLLGKNNEITLIYWQRTKEYIWGNNNYDCIRKEIYIPANMGQPLKRIFPTARFTREAFRTLKRSKPDCIYLAGFEMLVIAAFYKRFFAKKVNIIYEVADLHRLQIQPYRNPAMKFFQKALYMLEKSLCKEIALLVCTSQKYYSSYYGNFISNDKYLYMANAPERTVFEGYQKKTDGEFTVGFVGAVQFTRQIRLLVDAGKQCGIRVLIAGSFLDAETREYCVNNGAICTGTYHYETDIAGIYEKLDCVFAAYASEDANVRLALPNKLYESVVCGLPIIVAKGTYLSEIVEQHQIGISINSDDINEYIAALRKLAEDSGYYQVLVRHCDDIREECYIDLYNQMLLKKVSNMGDIST